MTEALVSEKLNEYLIHLVPERPPEMMEMEAYAKANNFPIIGPAAGYACYVLTRIVGAKFVFELGSGYGYSTAWFAKAVMENGGGIVNHVVWDEGLSQMARKHLNALGYQDILRYTIGEAIQALRESHGNYDLIFNDINKEAYPESLEVIERKLRPGGLLIVDNAFRGGRVLDLNDRSAANDGVRELTRQLTRSEAWLTTILPIRDGLFVAFHQ